MTIESNVAVIGGGIVGLATALELTNRFPQLRVAVLEKEAEIAAHQTSHNSGVIHSGIYYRPGSLKATLCTKGAALLMQFCQEHGVSYDMCGKLILATNENELPQLEQLLRKGNANRLAGLRMLSADQIKEVEPYAAGIRGIHVPGTGIVDYKEVAAKYAELFVRNGGSIYLSHEVIGLQCRGNYTIIETTGEDFSATLVINCSGLHSDRVTRMSTARRDMMIVPFRGEYYEIVPSKRHYVRSLIYPVPDPRYPFLGVHFTRRIGGGVEAGPNAVLALHREGYTKYSFGSSDVLELATFPGFWRMAATHWRLSLGEYYRSINKAAFVRALQRLIPSVMEDDLQPGGSGVRAQALDSDGHLVDDFRFVQSRGILHVANVPSPAATASLAIARHIVDLAATDVNSVVPKPQRIAKIATI
jgi:L-2-hydroxyglutarate oxidase LhgO